MPGFLTSPVLFIIFNRPDTTLKVFDAIRKAKPARLFVAADGPREGRENDAASCSKARDVVKEIDWDCEVVTLFRESNLGCRVAVSSAITWFFDQVEEGIILEDDCLPDQSFFLFCQELLERYRHDQRVMMISGDNFQDGIERGEGDYYFSMLSHVWGWATWRRAWRYYDVDIQSFPAFLAGGQINNIFEDRYVCRYWMRVLQDVYDKRIDTWDYQWAYTVFSSHALSIIPNRNLVSNIGFGQAATHIKDHNYKYAHLKAHQIKAIKHPAFMLPDRSADAYTFTHHYGIISSPFRPLKKIMRKVSGR